MAQSEKNIKKTDAGKYIDEENDTLILVQRAPLLLNNLRRFRAW